MSDSIQRFMLDDLNIRGALLHISEISTQLMQKRSYPDYVATKLNELLAITALMADGLKFSGSLNCQLRLENSSISFIDAQCNNKGEVRAYAHYTSTVNKDNKLLTGLLTIIVDNHNERWASTVPINHEQLSDAMNDYFMSSEQIPTYFKIVANKHVARAIILQQLPTKLDNAANFEHSCLLASSLKEHELITLNNIEILKRAYHQENTLVFDSREICFKCTCSKNKCAAVLSSLGIEEIKSQLQQCNPIVINCSFCGAKYSFDAKAVELIFADV